MPGGTIKLIVEALQEGVVLAGGVVAMQTLDNGLRDWNDFRTNHSFCIVGHCIVLGESYFICKDTQREDCFGVKGCALLPMKDFETRLEEAYVVKQLPQP